MGGWGCTTGRSGPGAIGPRSGPDCTPIGPDCTVGPRSGPDCAVGPRSDPDCAVGPRSGRDRAVTRSFALQGGILSNTGGKDGPGRSARILGGVWCCWGYRPSLCCPGMKSISNQPPRSGGMMQSKHQCLNSDPSYRRPRVRNFAEPELSKPSNLKVSEVIPIGLSEHSEPLAERRTQLRIGKIPCPYPPTHNSDR